MNAQNNGELHEYQEKESDDIFSKEKKPADVFLQETANILNDLRFLAAGNSPGSGRRKGGLPRDCPRYQVDR